MMVNAGTLYAGVLLFFCTLAQSGVAVQGNAKSENLDILIGELFPSGGGGLALPASGLDDGLTFFGGLDLNALSSHEDSASSYKPFFGGAYEGKPAPDSAKEKEPEELYVDEAISSTSHFVDIAIFGAIMLLFIAAKLVSKNWN